MNRLHPIAQAVQSQGRGNDTQLVHMTPGEVQGLQALAMAHGGSLSINPETGLPEAGFLESILPTVAGFALNAAFPGLGTLGSAMITGLGATALSGGDLGKGLMAGLGAWGGAGMAESLLGQASKAAAANIASSTPSQLSQGIANPAAQMAKAPSLDRNMFDLGRATSMGAPSQLAQGVTNPIAPMTKMPSLDQNMFDLGRANVQYNIPSTPAPTTTLETLQAGAKSAMEAPGQFLKDNWQYAGAAAAPVAMGMMTPEGTTVPADNEQFRYTYDPGRASEEDLAAQRAANPYGELKYFRPTYGPRQTVRVAQGGEIGYADGGTIDLSGTINLGGQGAQGGASAGMPNNSFTPMSGGLMGGLGALLGASPDALVREHGGISGNPMMLSNAQYDGRPIRKQTYEEYLAGRSPLQQDVQLTREQFENPAPYSTLGGPSSMFAKGGEIGYADGGTSDYEYDPVTQTYKKKVSAPVGAVPSVGVPGSGGASGGDGAQPLSKETIDFLDKETPAERDARMGKINDILSMIAPGSIARALVGGANSLTGGGVGPTPAPVVDRNIYTEPGSSGESSGNSGEQYGGETYGGDTGYSPTGESLLAQGGLAGLAAGGMSKGGFVVPADVVSALGNGSTDAGLRALNKKLAATPIKGKGDGLSDSIPTSIDGKQPARVADGEAYISPQTVAKIGGGDAKKGAKKLYAMMDRIRQQAHGKKSQQRRVNPNTAV